MEPVTHGGPEAPGPDRPAPDLSVAAGPSTAGPDAPPPPTRSPISWAPPAAVVEAGESAAPVVEEDAHRPRRWRRVVVVALLGWSAVSGLVLAREAAVTEEAGPLVVGALLVVPAIVATVRRSLRARPVVRTRRRVAAGLAGAGLVGAIGVSALAIDHCDKWEPGVDLHGCSLAGRNLSGADLTGATLRDADLSGADLRGTTLSGADLAGADLSGADLRDADLDRAVLVGANLAGADLGGAQAGGADLSQADLQGAALARTTLTGAVLARANLADARLEGTNLGGANLGGARLAGARLEGTVVTKSDLTGADLRGAAVGGAVLEGATLAAADLSGARITASNLRAAKAGRASFAGAAVRESDLSGADLSGADFTGATLASLTLDRANLVDTKGLDRATLAGAFGVDPAGVSRALSARSLALDQPSRMAAALRNVCQGAPVEGAHPYEPSPSFHATAVFTDSGTADGGEVLTALQRASGAGRWGPAALAYAELVVCVGPQETAVVSVCGSYTSVENGRVITVRRVRQSQTVRVVSALTGQAVASRQFQGDAPRACRSSESFGSWETRDGVGTISGPRPSGDAVAEWVAGIVRA